jgi:hypothetical protein
MIIAPKVVLRILQWAMSLEYCSLPDVKKSLEQILLKTKNGNPEFAVSRYKKHSSIDCEA